MLQTLCEPYIFMQVLNKSLLGYVYTSRIISSNKISAIPKLCEWNKQFIIFIFSKFHSFHYLRNRLQYVILWDAGMQCFSGRGNSCWSEAEVAVFHSYGCWVLISYSMTSQSVYVSMHLIKIMIKWGAIIEKSGTVTLLEIITLVITQYNFIEIFINMTRCMLTQSSPEQENVFVVN